MTIGRSVFPSALRARIDGAVIRLPGTGEGVARLVPVSMVKVDMAASSSRAAPRQPVLRHHRSIDNSRNINWDRFVELTDQAELKMRDRKWLGDIGLVGAAQASFARDRQRSDRLRRISPLLQRFSLPG
jgi:hypothetical protein